MVAPLNTQMLIDAITVPGVSPIGTPNPDLYNPRYGEASSGKHSSKLTPGKVEIFNGSKYSSGFSPWIELSSMDRNKVDAKVDLIGHVFALWKSTGKWTEVITWGKGAGGFAAHAFSWGNEHGTFKLNEGPVGWGSVDQGGVHFGDNDNDPQGGGNAFVRAHCWPMSYTGTNGFFWLSTNPGVDTAPPDMNKVNDLDGIVHIIEPIMSGTQIAQAKYAMSIGIDTQWQDASRVNKPPGSQTGSASGFRLVKNGELIVMSTLSQAQAKAHPLTIYPGWATTGATGPTGPGPTGPTGIPVPPVTDTKHDVAVRTTTDIIVDGNVASSTVSVTKAISV